MTRKEKKALELLKLLDLDKHVSKEDIIVKTSEMTKGSVDGNSCKNYTALTEIYEASQWLINHHKILNRLPDDELKYDKIKPLK